MTTTIDQEQLTLWNTVKNFIEKQDEDTAKVILKTTIEKSLRLMNIYPPIMNYLDFKIPTEDELDKLKEMDRVLRQEMIHSTSSATFEKVLDYLRLISSLTENPPLAYKKMVASILAKKSRRRIRLPRGRHAVTQPVEAKLVTDEPREALDSFQELINQQFYEDNKKAKTPQKPYYTTSEAAEKLGLSDQTIRRMCENGRLKGVYRSGGKNGHWRIPEENFITTRKQDQEAEAILKQIDKKNKEAGDVDEFDL